MLSGFFTRSFTAAVAISIIATPYTLAGSGTSGGGHEIEAHFKARIISVLNKIKNWDQTSIAKLKFDPMALLAKAVEPEGMIISCATGDSLTFIVNSGKMAYVGVPGQPVETVFLDCRDKEQKKNWKTLFSSENPDDDILFLHEALRSDSTPAEDEDNYGVSGSYLLGVENEKNIHILPGNANLSFNFTFTPGLPGCSDDLEIMMTKWFENKSSHDLTNCQKVYRVWAPRVVLETLYHEENVGYYYPLEFGITTYCLPVDNSTGGTRTPQYIDINKPTCQ